MNNLNGIKLVAITARLKDELLAYLEQRPLFEVEKLVNALRGALAATYTPPAKPESIDPGSAGQDAQV